MLEAGVLLKYVAPLLKNSKLIQTKLRRLRYLIKHGRLEVVVFGPGGTGKSTLGSLLTGDYKPGGAAAKYKESITVEPFPLQGDIVGQLLVAPGQELRRETNWPRLFRDLASGKSVGVINIVAYGYHAFENETYKELRVYKAGMTQQAVLDAFLEERRGVELEVIDALLPHIHAAKGKLWMVTLITKEDLWWKRRTDVEQYYKQGEYDKRIQQIVQKRGSHNFIHEYVSASLVLNNMTTAAEGVFAPTTEGYDQTIQTDHLQRLLDTFDVLAKQ